MKKIFCVMMFAILFCLSIFPAGKVEADIEKYYMAIVIDDFGGYNRNGVENMLSLDIPLTCAIMPGCENTEQDAISAHQNGHEVILHMPMEAHTSLPEEWYGRIYIKNNDSPSVARQKVEDCLSLVPYVKGLNIHIGSGVSKNKEIMNQVMQGAKQKGMYFCDSKTVENSICEQCAKDNQTDFVARDEFLEQTHNANYYHAKQMLLKGAKQAKEKGYSVVIGHVGAEGGMSTYNAIKDSIYEIQELGVEIVPLSKVVSVKYGRSR
ncbi:MAG: divergent polysaccharide deacetylase family protein [Clostridia bacterium]|nr:divergent polysaccharide deacetylase family protein [Clostridia bacterium]